MYDFGTIVLIPFPFTDLTSAKVRPALIVSENNKQRTDVTVCFISSKTAPKANSAAAIDSTEESGLKIRSFVRFDKIATISKRIILGELGRVPPDFASGNRKKFFGVFGF